MTTLGKFSLLVLFLLALMLVTFLFFSWTAPCGTFLTKECPTMEEIDRRLDALWQKECGGGRQSLVVQCE